MSGAFIEVTGDTEGEVEDALRAQIMGAAKLGLTDVRAQVIEPDWVYTTPSGEKIIAAWGGVIWVHS